MKLETSDTLKESQTVFVTTVIAQEIFTEFFGTGWRAFYPMPFLKFLISPLQVTDSKEVEIVTRECRQQPRPRQKFIICVLHKLQLAQNEMGSSLFESCQEDQKKMSNLNR